MSPGDGGAAVADAPETAPQRIGGIGGLQYDSGMLQRLRSSMDQIQSVLDHAGGMANNDAVAAGEEHLEEAIHDFADEWRKTREKMLKDIDSFTSMVDGVMKSFTELESNLTQAITPPSAPAAASLGGFDG